MIDVGDRSVDLIASKKFLNTRHRASELEVLTNEQGKTSHGIPDLVKEELDCESGAYLHSVAHPDKSYDR